METTLSSCYIFFFKINENEKLKKKDKQIKDFGPLLIVFFFFALTNPCTIYLLLARLAIIEKFYS